MKTRWILLFAILASFSMVGCGLSEKAAANKAAAEAELKLLQGKWKIAFREGTLSEDEDEDEPEKPEPGAAYYYVIDKDILREEFAGKDGTIEVLSQCRISVGPGKSPKTIDLIYVDERGKEIKERSSKRGLTGKWKTVTKALKDVGIYKIEGDKLELCMSWDEKNRPTDFTVPPRSSRYLTKLEKVKEASDDKGSEK